MIDWFIAGNAPEIRLYSDIYKSLPPSQLELVGLSKSVVPLGSGIQYHLGAYNTAALYHRMTIKGTETVEIFADMANVQLCFHASEILKIVDAAKSHLTQSKDDFCCGDSPDCTPGENSGK